MTSINNVVKCLAKGVFSTTDATATDIEVKNNLAEMLPESNDEAVVRVACKVTARNRHFAAIAYYFEVHALFEYNRFENNEFHQIGTATSTTHSEPASSVLTCTMNDDNSDISLQIAGEAGETFDWNYEAQINAAVIDEHLDWLTFQIFDGLSGVANLDEDIEVNGTTVSPTFVYYGGDATNSDWTAQVGETLTKIAGTPTLNDGSPCLGSDDDSVLCDGSTYYQDSGSSFGDIGTNDVIFMGLIKGGSSKYLASKRDGSSEGWNISCTGTRIALVMEDGSTNTATVYGASNSFLDGEWGFFVICIDRDEASVNGSSIITNGSLTGTGVDFSSVGDADSTVSLTFGATTTGTSGFDSNIAYFAMYQGADLFPGGSLNVEIFENLAAKRFAQVSGRYPQNFTHDTVITDGDCEAVGTGDWNVLDSTLSKDTTAPLYEGTQHLRITSTTDSFYAYQSITISGHKYRVTGVARSVSGSAIPQVYRSVGEVWGGTSSTDWQEFDETFVASATNLFFGSSSSHPGVVDFDDITVTRVDELPIVATRAFAAYLDKIESDGTRKLYYVGSEWLRQCYRNDGTYDVYGYLPEAQSTNQISYSQELDNAAWVQVNIASIDVDAITAPDGTTTADGLISDGTSGNHTVHDVVATSAGTDTFSFWAKKGDSVYDWVRGYITTIGASCFFDLDAGVVGTSANCTGYIENWGNGWFRCILVFTGDGSSRHAYIYSAEADGDATFSGNSSDVDTYIWGIQYEQGMDYASSYIPTSGGTSTRLADQLRHKGDDGNITDNGQGAVVCDFYLENYDTQNTKRIMSFNDGGAAADRISAYASSSSDVLAGQTAATAGNAGFSSTVGDISDGSKHTARLVWKTDLLTAYLDGVPDASPDISCDIPDDIDRIEIGSSYALGTQFSGLLRNLRIYNTPITRG